MQRRGGGDSRDGLWAWLCILGWCANACISCGDQAVVFKRVCACFVAADGLATLVAPALLLLLVPFVCLLLLLRRAACVSINSSTDSSLSPLSRVSLRLLLVPLDVLLLVLLVLCAL